jgi:hypothetical protein
MGPNWIQVVQPLPFFRSSAAALMAFALAAFLAFIAARLSRLFPAGLCDGPGIRRLRSAEPAMATSLARDMAPRRSGTSCI